MSNTVTAFSVASYVLYNMHTVFLHVYCHTVRSKLLISEDLCTVHNSVMISSGSGHSNTHYKHGVRERAISLCVLTSILCQTWTNVLKIYDWQYV